MSSPRTAWMLALSAILMAPPSGPAPGAADATTRPGAATSRVAAGRGPLAALPSAPGPHVARIRDLPPGGWLNLGSPAADPNWGRARGRSWTPRMPYVPDRRAALLCGCGVHGYVKPDGHFMDDLWAYDIHGHRWICLYPGAPVKTLRLKLDRHGFEADSAGRHVPVSFMGHGYCNQTYLPELRRLMLIYTHNPWWTRAIPQRWEWLDANDDNIRRRNYGHAGPVIESPKHPLFYDLAAGGWTRQFIPGDGPGPTLFEGLLEYLPTSKEVFFLYRGQVWFYEARAGRWRASKAPRVPVEYDSWGCYDSKRNCVYVARKELFLAFDVAGERWREIRGADQPADLGSCVHGAITYDGVADSVVLLLDKGRGLRIYRPADNAWQAGPPPPADVDWKHGNVNGFHDPILGVHFYHLAGDSDDNGVMLVYRHARRP